MKILIVGGVAGGATAAARLRRLDEKSEIIMFERGEYISFANCGLPYYIGDVIQSRDALLVQSVEGMTERFNIDIRNFSEVKSIDRENKRVKVKNLKTMEEYEESYDYLILSPGAKPIKPPIEGIDSADNIFTLRNIPDTDAIKEQVTKNNLKDAVVIGGGFIGIEMAENLHHLGLNVSLVEMSNQVMAPFDLEMANILHSHIVDKGVNLILSDGVKAFKNNGKEIELSSGKTIKSDITILSIGVSPENELAKEAGLKLSERGFIVVDDRLRTEDESIFAVGDAIYFKEAIYNTEMPLALAGPANRQARLVADTIYNRGKDYKGFLGTSVAKVFDLTAASTGLNEKKLKSIGKTNYEKIHIHPNSHAGYYPGAEPMTLKVLFEIPSGKLLGAQAIGRDGVEKRIDVIATALSAGLNARDLTDIELSYAPPFSSAKDPVNMAGYVAENILDNFVEIVGADKVDELIEKGAVVLDVRNEEEIILGEIKGATNIPLHLLRDRINELSKDKEIYTTCQVGLRGYIAARILKSYGYKVKNIDGGYKTYMDYKGMTTDQGFTGDDGINIVQSSNPISCSDNPDLLKKKMKTVDARGLQCPGPIAQVFKALKDAEEGDVFEVLASDPGFKKDIGAWCIKTGNTLLDIQEEKDYVRSIISKGSIKSVTKEMSEYVDKTGATFVVFSGDLDKALASFIIATGAASMGKEVTMFFTFWGLNILRKKNVKLEKGFMDKMFGTMMPEGTDELKISKMNMMGLGTKMIKNVMKEKNVDSLETLLLNAQNMGVKFVACAMSMDIMGIQKEELIDGVEIAGVATYLAKTEEAGLNLFI